MFNYIKLSIMFRTFTTKIKSFVTIKIKHKHQPIKQLLYVKEDYTYSKRDLYTMNKQKQQDAIHKYWRYHHGDEL